jgi:hypothetical protein
LGAKGNFLWDFLTYDIYGYGASGKYSDGTTSREILSKIGLSFALTDNWFVNLDACIHNTYLEATPDSILFDKTSVPVFASVAYKPIENVKFELYWGVHPDLPNGWTAARRDFILNYMNETGANYAEAWRQLERVRQIGLRGEIEF